MKPFNLEEAKVGKPIVCRDGTPAKLIAYVSEARFGGVLFLVEDRLYQGGVSGSTTNLGQESHEKDLFMAPEKRTVWMNIYSPDGDKKCGDGWYWPTKEEADRLSAPDRIACVPVTFMEGEGL